MLYDEACYSLLHSAVSCWRPRCSRKRQPASRVATGRFISCRLAAMRVMAGYQIVDMLKLGVNFGLSNIDTGDESNTSFNVGGAIHYYLASLSSHVPSRPSSAPASATPIRGSRGRMAIIEVTARFGSESLPDRAARGRRIRRFRLHRRTTTTAATPTARNLGTLRSALLGGALLVDRPWRLASCLRAPSRSGDGTVPSPLRFDAVVSVRPNCRPVSSPNACQPHGRRPWPSPPKRPTRRSQFPRRGARLPGVYFPRASSAPRTLVPAGPVRLRGHHIPSWFMHATQAGRRHAATRHSERCHSKPD